jgi:hypothetical protein
VETRIVYVREKAAQFWAKLSRYLRVHGDAGMLELDNPAKLPAVVVTTEFLHEAEVQREALGMPKLSPVVIDHPLSTLSEAEIDAETDWIGAMFQRQLGHVQHRNDRGPQRRIGFPASRFPRLLRGHGKLRHQSFCRRDGAPKPRD